MSLDIQCIQIFVFCSYNYLVNDANEKVFSFRLIYAGLMLLRSEGKCGWSITVDLWECFGKSLPLLDVDN